MPAFTGLLIHLNSQRTCEFAAWYSPDIWPMPWVAQVAWLDHWVEFEGTIADQRANSFVNEARVQTAIEAAVQALGYKVDVLI